VTGAIYVIKRTNLTVLAMLCVISANCRSDKRVAPTPTKSKDAGVARPQTARSLDEILPRGTGVEFTMSFVSE
jgi:hypothetical protein